MESTALQLNPDAALVVTQIPFRDFAMPTSDDSGVVSPPLVAPESVPQPERARIRFLDFMDELDPMSTPARQTIRLNSRNQWGEQLQDGDIVCLRWWIDPEPDGLQRSSTIDYSGDHQSVAGLRATIVTSGPLGPFYPTQAPQMIVRSVEGEPIRPPHIRHVAKRTRERYRRPSHTIRVNGPA